MPDEKAKKPAKSKSKKEPGVEMCRGDRTVEAPAEDVANMLLNGWNKVK